MNSTSRGRGANRGGAKKPVLPNISAAGRREQLTNDAGEGTSRGRGDGRRGRRGGRGGRGRGSKQQGIIQSEGIFSMGLADHGVRQRGMKRDAGEEQIIGRLDSYSSKLVKREDSGDDERDDAYNEQPRITYETQWMSDEEGDAEDLAELLNDSFISDLRKGSEMPLVLPAKDAPQFRKILSRKAKLSDLSDVDMKDPLDARVSAVKTKYEVFSDASDNESETATIQKSLLAGSVIRRQLHSDDNSLMLLQLPTSLSAIAAQLQLSNTEEPSTTVEAGKPQPAASAAGDRNCVEAFPDGVEIGRLQLLRSGRVVLNIGGQLLDVSEAIPTGCADYAAKVEVPAVDNAQLPKTEFGAGALLGGGPSAFTPLTNGRATGVSIGAGAVGRPTPTVQLYGQIHNSFVTSYNFHNALRLKAGHGAKARHFKKSPTRQKKS